MPTQWSEAEQVPLGCIAPPFYERTPVDFVGGDAHAVERSGTSTLGVYRPAAPAGAKLQSLPL